MMLPWILTYLLIGIGIGVFGWLLGLGEMRAAMARVGVVNFWIGILLATCLLAVLWPWKVAQHVYALARERRS